MSASNVRDRSTAANSDASTLRPRNKRLISGLDEGDETVFDPSYASSSRIPSPAPGRYTDRPASPIPSAHPQRSLSRTGDRLAVGSLYGKSVAIAGQRKGDSPKSTNFWGHSWNALQGIASDLLGNDPPPTNIKDKLRVRRPLSRLDHQRSASSGPGKSWGPPTPSAKPMSNGIGGGTREEQTAVFRAQKKKNMLTGKESSYADALGKFKRRLSDDRASSSAPPGDNDEREALIYVHHVQKDDTLAGITIRYNIAANILRKANRMWPNDAVQTRQTLILPVDACAVKGRPCPGQGEEIDLLGSESEALSTLQAEEVPPTPELSATIPNSPHARSDLNRDNSVSNTTTSSTAISNADAEPPWHHDSWVLLPGQTKPTEIARLPRRALGYFPPARRKSQPRSATSTPTTSLDISRSDGAADVLGSPARRARRPSNATNGYFPTYLTGPGGVGTMSRNVHFPGPAQDGLNKLFAKHLPDVAPPRNQNALYQPEMPLYPDEEPTPVGSGLATPAYPQGGGGAGPGNLGFENLGGAIEGWVRKIARNTKAPAQERISAARASVGAPGRGAGSIGDLIEMTDEFEIGGEEDEVEEERGRQGTAAAAVGATPRVRVTGPGQVSSGTSYFDGGAARRGIGSGGAKGGKTD